MKIHDIVAMGGGGTSVDFRADVQNVGNKTTRATVTARVGDVQVDVQPSTVELLPDAPSTTVQIHVPRPRYGNLV